jgi:hypothetical protein
MQNAGTISGYARVSTAVQAHTGELAARRGGSNMTQTRVIPASILAILTHRWQEADSRYSSFASVFNDKDDKGRRSHPSYYHIRPGKKVEIDFDVLANEEAAELVKEGAFGSLAKVQKDGTVTINEHAQHALTDFCSEVYSAWEKYQKRIAASVRERGFAIHPLSSV